jgi:hypothetical protein
MYEASPLSPFHQRDVSASTKNREFSQQESLYIGGVQFNVKGASQTRLLPQPVGVFQRRSASRCGGAAAASATPASELFFLGRDEKKEVPICRGSYGR